ncbi:MAG: class III lanthionine synthetase LanKC [Acidimicrobiales bacterium]
MDKSQFMTTARANLGSSWTLTQTGHWTFCHPARALCPLPTQGWKFHVSATPENGERILGKVTAAMARTQTPFKFLQDPSLLAFSNGKRWRRGHSGKFITVYPATTSQFLRIGEELEQILAGECGPYILSDRRYKGSPCLYYRYGGIQPEEILRYDGRKDYLLTAPDGSRHVDTRFPYFKPPAWVTDPLPPDPPSTEEANTLNDGRYLVLKALNFSNSGGVYLARDRATNTDVAIKEARPHTVVHNGVDAAELLSKEHRILARLSGLGVSPTPLQIFDDWEHRFLVEEYVDGGFHLTQYLASNSPVLRRQPSKPQIARHYQQLKRMWSAIADALAIVHANGIVFGDLSPRNFLIKPRSFETVLIDFESAYDLSAGEPYSALHTEGFSLPHRESRPPAEQDDIFALAAVILYSVWPSIKNAQFAGAGATRGFATAVTSQLGVHASVVDTAVEIVEAGVSGRSLDVSAADIAELCRRRAKYRSGATPDSLLESVSHTELSSNIVATARSATAFLFGACLPLDRIVSETTNVNFAHGLTGVHYALNQMGGEVPDELHKYMRVEALDADKQAVGLHTGMAGTSWAISEVLGIDHGVAAIRYASRHPLLNGDVERVGSDLAHGLSGWGLAQLYFYIQTGEASFLDAAVRVGEVLQSRAVPSNTGSHWEGDDVGYGLGASGVGHFLTELAIETGSVEFRALAGRALQYDLDFGRRTADGGLTFPQTRSQGHGTTYPYWFRGSAGVGTALVRFIAAGDAPEHFGTALDEIIVDATRRFAALPGMYSGLAGLGTFLLDCLEFGSGTARCERGIRLAADGLTHFARQRLVGTGFPGDDLTVDVMDVATGAAGIGLFFHRVHTKGHNPFLFLEGPRARRNARGQVPSGGVRAVFGDGHRANRELIR